MAVLAQYTPPPDAQYGRSANEFFSGLNESASLMERKQAMALRQQQADQQRMEFIAKLPALQAETQLQQTKAAVAVKNATDLIHFDQQAAIDSPVAQQEFLDAMKSSAIYDVPASDGSPEDEQAQAEAGKYATQATLDARSQKLAAIAAKYSYMAVIPEYKGFINRVNAEAANAHLQAASNLRLEELMNAAQYRADASRYGADVRASATVGAAGIRADASTQNTETRTQGRLTEQQMRNEGSLQQIAAKGENAVEKDAKVIQYLSSEAVRADQEAKSVEATDPALAETLRTNAARLRDQMVKKSTYAGGSPSSPTAPGAPVPRPAAPVDNSPSPAIAVSIPGSELPASNGGVQTAAVAPTKVDSKASTVSIGNKTYPIFSDKHGNRAYLIDGHYVPIDTQ